MRVFAEKASVTIKSRALAVVAPVSSANEVPVAWVNAAPPTAVHELAIVPGTVVAEPPRKTSEPVKFSAFAAAMFWLPVALLLTLIVFDLEIVTVPAPERALKVRAAVPFWKVSEFPEATLTAPALRANAPLVLTVAGAPFTVSPAIVVAAVSVVAVLAVEVASNRAVSAVPGVVGFQFVAVLQVALVVPVQVAARRRGDAAQQTSRNVTKELLDFIGRSKGLFALEHEGDPPVLKERSLDG